MPFEVPVSPSCAKYKKIEWGKACEWHAEVILENWGLELRTLNDASKLFYDKDNPLTFALLAELDRMSCEHEGKGRAVVAALIEETSDWPHKRRFIGSLIMKQMRARFQRRKFAIGNFHAVVDGGAMTATRDEYAFSASLQKATAQGGHSIAEDTFQSLPAELVSVRYGSSPGGLQGKQMDSLQELWGGLSAKSEPKQGTSRLAKLEPGPETLTAIPHLHDSIISNQRREHEPKSYSAQTLNRLPHTHSAPTKAFQIGTRRPDHKDSRSSQLSKTPMKRKQSDEDLDAEMSASWGKGSARKRSALGQARDSVGERRRC